MDTLFGSMTLDDRDREMDVSDEADQVRPGLRRQRPGYDPRDAGERERCDRAQAMIVFLQKVFANSDKYLTAKADDGVPGITTYCSYRPALRHRSRPGFTGCLVLYPGHIINNVDFALINPPP